MACLVVDVAGLDLVGAIGRDVVVADLGAKPAAEVVVEHAVVRTGRALLAVQGDRAAGEQVVLDQDVPVAARFEMIALVPNDPSAPIP